MIQIRRLLPLMAITACLIGLVLPGCDTLVTEITEITTAGHPTAEFGLDTNSVDSGCVPLTVTFIDKSSGPHNEWSWYFGDGDSSNDTNPTHTYDSAGTYTVTLFIRNYEGIDEEPGVDNEVKNRFIIVGTTINSFTASPTVGCQGMEVTFAPIEYGGITNFSWNFGDGSPVSSDSNPTHVYDSADVFACTLTVTGECGTKVIGYDSLITINPCPVARIWVNTLYGCKPLIVEFIDTTDYRGQDRDSVFWRIEGGGLIDTSNKGTFTDTFEDQGKYTVNMTAYSAGGEAVDTLDDTIMVWGSAFGLVTANGGQFPVEGCVNDLWLFYVDFEAMFPDTVDINSFDSLVWHFGDGKRSSPADPMPIQTRHGYDTAGTHSIALLSYGKCAADTAILHSIINIICVDERFESSLVGMTIGPDADTAASGIQGDTSVVFTFTDTSSLSGLTWTWDFGDDLGDTLQVVTHQYSDTGTFIVTLTLANCCNDTTLTDTIVIDTMATEGAFRRYRDSSMKR